MHLVAGRLLAPQLGQFASLNAVDGQLAGRLVLQVKVVLLDGLRITSCLVQHLGQAQVDNAVRIVVSDGVQVGTGCLAGIVDQSVTFRHAKGDVSAQVAFLRRGLGVDLPVDGSGFIIFANPLFLLCITQLG